MEKGPTLAISLTVKNAAKALDYYARAFGAEELVRIAAPDGSVGHAEFKIGDSRIFISGEHAEWKAFAMPEGTLASSLLCLMTDDCDAAFERAIAAGGTSVAAPKDEFWGMRSAVVADPFGYRWSLGQVIEDVTPEEVAKRAEALYAEGA